MKPSITLLATLALLLSTALTPSTQAQCTAQQLPIVEHMESCGHGSASALPSCWVRLKNYDNSELPYVMDYVNNHVMKMYSGNLDYHFSMLLMPEANVASLSQCYLLFRAWPESAGARLVVGVSSDTTLMGHGFVPVDTIELGQVGEWEEYRVPLTSYTGTGKYVTFRFAEALQESTSSYVRIDDVMLTTCGVDSLWASHLTHNSLRLHFTTYGNAAVDLEYGPYNFAAGTGTTVQGVSSPHTVTGLNASTNYTFRLTPTCGTTAVDEAAKQLHVQTLSGSSASAPVCDGPEGYYNGYTWLSPYLTHGLSSQQVILRARGTSDYGRRLVVATTAYPEEQAEWTSIDTLEISASWEYYSVPLTAAPSGDHYVVLAMEGGSLYIDHFSIAPTYLHDAQAVALGETSIELSWQGGGAASLEYGPQGFTVGSGTTVSGSSPHTLSGLAAGTAYDIVLTPTSTSGSGCSTRLSATTWAAPVPAPFCEDFEATNVGDMPAGWTVPEGSPTSPRVVSTGYEGNRRMYMNANTSYGQPSCYAVLPAIGGDLSQLYLSFQAYVSAFVSGRVIDVGVMTNPHDTSTFQLVQTLQFPQSNTYRHMQASLSTYQGNGRYIALRYRMTQSGNSGACYVDNVRVTHNTVSACYDNSNPTSNSITLNWTTTPPRLPVHIEWSTADNQFGSGTRTVVTADSMYTLTGLAANQNYYVYVWTGADSTCGFDFKFTHSTAAPQALPYCTDFSLLDQFYRPDAWQYTLMNNEYPYVNSSHYLAMSVTGGRQNLLALPAFAGDVSDAVLALEAYWNNTPRLVVGVMDVPSRASSFTPVDTLEVADLSTDAEHPSRFVVPLASYAGSGRHLALWLQEGDFFIDALSLAQRQLENARVTAISDSSVTLAWDAVPAAATDSIYVAYGTAGFTVGGNGQIGCVPTTGNPFTLTGLDESATYDIVLLPQCGAGCPYARLSATTRGALQQLALCYDFENTGNRNFPDRWVRSYEGRGYPTVVYGNDAYYSDASMKFCIYYSDINLIATPPVDVDVMSDLMVSFKYKYTSQDSNMLFVVGVMSNPEDSASFVPVDTISQSESSDIWRSYSRPLAGYAGMGRSVAFKYYDATQQSYSNFYLDNLTLSLCAIENERVTNIDDQSITLEWDEVEPYAGSGVFIEYSTQPFSFGEGTRISATSSPTTIGNLASGQQYYLYVVPQCQEGNPCGANRLEASTTDGLLQPPYCEKFEGDFPEGWFRPAMYGGWPDVRNSSERSYLHLETNVNGICIVALPLMDNSVLRQSYLSFDANMWYQNARLDVGVMTNPYDTSSFSLITTFYVANYGQAWSHYEVPLSSYQGSGGYVALRYWSSDRYDCTSQLTNLTLRSCSLHSVTFSRVTQSSVQMSWDTLGANTGVWVEYALVGSANGEFTPGYGTRLFLTQSGSTIGGLLPGSYYTFHVWPQCDTVDDGCSYYSTTVQTVHPEISFPHCEDFEEIETNSFPNNWRRLTNNNYQPRVMTYGAESNHVLRYESARQGYYAITAMPPMGRGDTCTSLRGSTIRFKCYLSISNYVPGIFEVGVMDDVSDTASFTPLDTVVQDRYTWYEHETSLADYNGTGRYIAFRLRATGNSSVYAYIDDVCVEACEVTNLRVSAISQNSITFSWQSSGEASLTCEYGPVGFAPGTGDTVLMLQSPTTITGLATGTTYQFRLLSNCDCDAYGAIRLGQSEGSWVGSGGSGGGGNGWVIGIISTEPDEQPLPYCTGFEGCDSVGFIPGWRRVKGSSEAYPRISPSRYHGGCRALELYTTTQADDRYATFAILPLLPDNEMSQLVMTFQALVANDYGTQEDAGLFVGVMTNPLDTSTFVPISRIRPSVSNSWQEQVVSFASYTGSGRYIAFRFAPRHATYSSFVDDIYLGHCAVSNVQYGNATSHTLQVSWTAHNSPSSVRVEYGPQDFRQRGLASTTAICTSNPFTITSLDCTESYDFYLIPSCGTVDGLCEQQPFTLNPNVSAPYCENFDGATTSLPAHWTGHTTHAAGADGPEVVEEGYLSMFPNTGVTGRRYAILPPIRNTALRNLTLSFNAWTNASNYTRLVVGVMSDPTDIASFVGLDTLQMTAINEWQHFVVPLASYQGSADRIVFMAYTTDGRRECRIDDLVAGFFVPPTEVEVSTMAADAVRITWAHDDDRTQPLAVEYGRLGFSNGTVVQATGDEAILTGLSPNTEYEFFFHQDTLTGGCERFRFTTPSRYAVPLCEQFDASSSLPEGWEGTSNVSNPYIQTYHSYSPSNLLRMDAQCYGEYSYVLLPELETDSMQSLYFDLMLYCQASWQNWQLVLGVMERRDDTTSFVPCDTIAIGNNENYSWIHRTATLRHYQGTGRTPAFLLWANTTWGSVFLDNITVTFHPHCTIVAGPDNDVFCQMADSAQVDYYLEYGREGFLQGTGTLLHVTENPFHLENLPNGASLDFYVLTAPGATTCEAPTTLTIYQEPRMPIPLCEDFDSYGESRELPPHWSKITGTNNYVFLSASGYDDSPHAVWMYASSSYPDPYLVMPLLDVDSMQRLAVGFMYMFEHDYADDKLIVGTLVDPADTSTFVPIDTIVCRQGYGNVWLSHVASLSHFRGTGRYLAFRFHSVNGNVLRLDNFSVDLLSGVEVRQEDNTTAHILSTQSQPDFYAYYGPASNAIDSYQRVHVTTLDHTLTGLTPGTLYRCICSSDSASDGSCGLNVNFFMAYCTSLSYCEPFESYAENGSPVGWTLHPSEQETGCIRVATGGNPSKGLYFYSSYRSADKMGVAVLPRFYERRVNELTISFDYKIDQSFFEIGVVADPTDKESFIPLDTLGYTNVSNGGQWQHASYSFASYEGPEGHIALRHSGLCYSFWWGSSDGATIDNISVESHNIPDAITAFPSGVQQLSVDWDDTTLTDFWIDYALQGVPLGEGTQVHVDHKPMVFSGMAVDSTYRFYALSDSAASSCRQPAVARVLTTEAVPYCENFDAYPTGSSSYPTQWRRLPRNDNNSNHYINATALSGTRSLYFASVGEEDYATTSIAILPLFSVDDINQLNVSFDMKASPESYFQIGVMDNPIDRSSFVPVDSVVSYDPTVWQHVRFSLASYAGTGQFLAIRLATTSGTVTGNIDNLSITDCDIPSTFAVNTIAHNLVELSWEGDAAAFSVEYGPEGFTPGTGTLLVHPANPTVLTLANSTTYDFYTFCDSAVSSCETPYHASTLDAPMAVPSCIGFEDCANNQVPAGWSVIKPASIYNNVTNAGPHTGSRCFCAYAASNTSAYTILPDLDLDSIQHLHLALWARISVASQGYLEIGVMSSVDDAASFIPVKRYNFSHNNTYEHVGASFASYTGSGRFVALRTVSTQNSIQIRFDDIYLSTCGATNFSVRDLTNESATLAWVQTGQPDITIEYGPEGFTPGTGTTVYPTASPYRIDNLLPLTHYTFRISADCDDMGAQCSSDEIAEFNIFTPMGGTGCVDYTDLEGADVTCTYGNYENPYDSLGIVDFGYESVSSRHTVHYDTTATDPRTGNLLRVVPPGSDASVRLGNWGTGAEAESITYGLSVDTNDFDLLILKYAAVLQDPAHGASHQPRFRIQILDSDMNLIDANCGAADFIANQNLGWNVAANYVLWKDWTTVGLDLSPYAGQRIYVRLTTFDCGESTHYGYAYFTLNCMRKSMQASGCGFVAENTFTAPSGFAYRWYSSANTDSTISTEQSITVASNNDVTYYCDASFVDNASCYFTLSAFAGTRFPLANFTYSYTVENCQFQVQFQNASTISMDGDTPLGTGEPCETALWDFGNGLTSTSYHGATTYAQPGSYDVTLYSGLAGDACIDSITITITLEDQTVRPLLIGPAEACEGDTVTFSVDHARTFHRWSTGSTSPTISFVADSSLMLRAVVVDSGGCADTLSHTLLVHRLAHVADYCNVCEQDLPYVWQDSLGYSTEQSGNATITFTDAFGCDSIVALHLAIHSSSESYLYDTIVENLLPWDFHSVTLQGDTTDMQLTLTNAAGCDSTLHYNLYVWANQAATADSTLCQNALPLTWNGCTFSHDSSATGSYTLSHQATLATTHGADSLLTMLLHVKVNTHGVVYDSVLENDLPYLFNGQTYTAGGTDTLLLVNADGCDSILVLHLEVHANSSATADSTVCYDALPLTWHGYTFTADTSSYPQTLTHTVVLPIPNAQGADSLLTMNLHVNPVHDVHLHQAICDDASYTFADSAYTATGTYTVAGLANQYGCDSTATLHLTVHPTFDHHIYDTICQGSQRPFGGNQYGSTGDFEHSYLSLHGCDSLSTLHLIVHPITYDTILDTILENQLPYTFNGHLCLDSGAFTITIPNVMGCDSVITYHLFVHRNVTTTLDSAVCDNQLPFLWDDTLFTASSLISTQHLLNVQGADSTVVRRLTVHPTYNQTFAQSVCTDALPFSWQGFAYDADPDTLPYTHQEALSLSLASLHGCDSLVTLTLAVNRTSTSSSTHTDCDSYQWNGTTYLLSGAYDHHLLNALGCDSLASLELTLHYSDTSEESVVSCGEYQWNGQSYSTTGRYEHWTQTAQGCDSLCVLQLRVPVVESERDEEACDRLQWNNHTYTFSGTYTQQFVTSDGCDSIATLHLTIYPSSEEHQQVTLCEADLPYQYNDILFPYGTQRGEQRIEYLDIHGCDSVIRLQLDIFYNPVLSVDMVRYHCYEGEFELQARHSADVDHVVWTSAPYDPTTLGQESDNPLFVSPHQATLYTATAQVPGTDCKNSLSLTVGPIVDLEAALSVTPGFATPAQSEITLRDESHGTVRTWLWLADGDEVGDRPSCAYRYPLEKDSVEIVLIVTEPRFGCHDTATTVVHLLGGDLFAPNAFTPGESTNQRFFVQGKNIIECEISIYARNGQRVYYSVDMAEGWDGRNQAGQPCPEGAYVYLVRYTTTESPRNPITRRGSVLLLR